MAGRDDYFKAAYNQLQLISQDENKRMEYEARQKAIRDYNEGMLESHERGLKQGRAEGRKEGRAEGRKEGRVEGRKEGRAEGRKEGRVEGRAEGLTEGERKKSIDIAKKLLAKSFSLNDIADITGLTIEQISGMQRGV